MNDPFEDFANEHQSRHSKRRESKAAERARQKELRERDYLFNEWRKWHAKRKQELLTGPYAEAATKLADFLEHMDIGDANVLVELVESQCWRMCDDDTRFLVTDLISHAIVYLRERADMEPFDDPIDGETNAFLTIRELLR